MTEPVNEADLLDQQADVVPEEPVPDDPAAGEADPADVREQQREVPTDED